jgi:hypothetical protein
LTGVVSVDQQQEEQDSRNCEGSTHPRFRCRRSFRASCRCNRCSASDPYSARRSRDSQPLTAFAAELRIVRSLRTALRTEHVTHLQQS